MRKILVVVLTLMSPMALAAPFVVSDPLDPRATHCGVLMDSAPKQVIPVTAEAGGNICKFDLSGVAEGSHTVRMTSIAMDGAVTWGESVASPPLSFVKQGVPNAPAGLELRP